MSNTKVRTERTSSLKSLAAAVALLMLMMVWISQTEGRKSQIHSHAPSEQTAMKMYASTKGVPGSVR